MPDATLDVFDLTILGGGPVGLFGAFYAGLRGMKIKVIDSLPELGGQLTTLYPEKLIFDVPGFSHILAKDLARNLIDQAMQYHPALCLDEVVRTLEPVSLPAGAGTTAATAPAYKLTSNKGVHYTRTVLIAAGAGAFSPKKLTLPEAIPLENHSVFYAVKSKAVFAGKNVLIVGGGDSAVDWALNLQDTAGKITLIHRRNQFRAHEESLERLRSSRTRIMPFYELEGLIADAGALTGAVIQNNQTQESQTLPVDAVIVQIGFNSSLGPMKDWPLKIERGSVVVNQHLETALPGVFAAGDGATYEGKLKLIATGFGEAATAVNYAKTRVDPTAKAFPGHSSELTPQHQSVGTFGAA